MSCAGHEGFDLRSRMGQFLKFTKPNGIEAAYLARRTMEATRAQHGRDPVSMYFHFVISMNPAAKVMEAPKNVIKLTLGHRTTAAVVPGASESGGRGGEDQQQVHPSPLGSSGLASTRTVPFVSGPTVNRKSRCGECAGCQAGDCGACR